MEKSLVVKNEIKIKAPASRVWEVLTDSSFTRQYMFGCEIISDWKVGSPFLWKGIFDGKELVAVKGTLSAIQEGQFLSYTTIDPNSSIEDRPENYTTVTYQLRTVDNVTDLEVTQGDFATVAEGEKRYKEVSENGGWQPILERIKELAEA
jgi:uncharacterized protein YndB with AHSA1/START domain